MGRQIGLAEISRMVDKDISIVIEVSEVVELERVIDVMERAHRFVEAEGSPLDRLRFRILLEKANPEALLEFLGPLQQDTGLFLPMLSAQAGTHERTGNHVYEADPASSLVVLALLDDHGLLQSELAGRCVQGLSGFQEADGTWGSRASSDLEERLCLTAMLASYLVKSGQARLAVTDAALEAVMAQWSHERVNASSCKILGAYSHLLTHQSHELADEALHWCGRELAKGLRGGMIRALELARIFLFCDVFALPGLPEEGGDLMRLIVYDQDEDGGFAASPSTLGLFTKSEAALTAVIALSRFSRYVFRDRLRAHEPGDSKA